MPLLVELHHFEPFRDDGLARNALNGAFSALRKASFISHYDPLQLATLLLQQ
jgi:hypothetical protein